jgi:Ca2+-binding RTX toxin-like protein
MAQASLDVNTSAGFNELIIFTQAFAGALFADALNPLEPLEFALTKKKLTFSFDLINLIYQNSFEIEVRGNFDVEKKTGEVKEIGIFMDGEEVAEVKNPGFDIKDIISLSDPNMALVAKIFGFNEKMIINGGRGDDILIAHAGEVHAGKGDDTILGFGKTLMDGGSDKDTVSYSFSEFGVNDGMGVTASLADSSQNRGLAKGDRYVSIENLQGTAGIDILYGDGAANKLYGGGGSDTLKGGGRADVLYGDGGDDYVDGGTGTDELWGDNSKFGVDGADTFVIGGPKQGLKTIMDYDVFDLVLLKRSGFGLAGNYQLTNETFVRGAGAEAATDQATFLYDTDTKELKFDRDGTGSAEAVVLAKVNFHQQTYLDLNDLILG